MAGPGYPSHRNADEPQPEVCSLCGTIVGGSHLQLTQAEGLQGMYICDVTEGCRRFRRLSGRDIRRLSPRPSASIGDSRVYPAGDNTWAG